MFEMEKLVCLFFLMQLAVFSTAQNPSDTLATASRQPNADDPSVFLTRFEVFNELQHYNNNDVYLNQTVLRTVIKLGKRFTTRIDLPYVYNSYNSPAKLKQSGIGDISFRLLGYKFFETRLSAFTASIEISMNTAASPLLGTGKNVLIPMVSYTKIFPTNKMIFSAVLQQTNSMYGDKNRSDINFSKLQLLLLKYLSKRTWIVIGPEWFLDYENGGLSMNLRTRFAYAPRPRLNIWITPSAGIFGDFVGRYQWSADAGARYFLFRE
jgi:hypothetical protein